MQREHPVIRGTEQRDIDRRCRNDPRPQPGNVVQPANIHIRQRFDTGGVTAFAGGRPEHQRVPHRGNIGSVADMIKVPGAVAGLAVQLTPRGPPPAAHTANADQGEGRQKCEDLPAMFDQDGSMLI